MESIINLNVVITPPEDVNKKLIEYSKRLASQFETVFTLNQTQFLPHFSQYSAAYPKKNYFKIKTELNEIAKNHRPFSVSLFGFSEFKGFIFFDVVKTPEVIQLHETIVDALNPLREGFISDNMKTLTNVSSAQKRAIETYGYVSAKELYIPHISLTCLKNPADFQQAVKLLPKDQITFEVDKLSLSPFAIWGTCPEILETFPFL